MRTAHPKISIVLPTRNGSRWLGEAINSILNQTESDWELIIVDDASTDNTFDIAKSFSNTDKRIRVIKNEINLRVPGSLNAGFSYASGKYRTWTSDDNLYKPNALRIMSSYLDDHPDVDLVSLNFDVIDEYGNSNGQWHSNTTQRHASQLTHMCNVGAAFMYTKEIAIEVGNYDADLYCAEDYDYWSRIALAGKIAYLDNINEYQYRQHKNSLTTTQSSLLQERTKQIQSKYFKKLVEKYKISTLPAADALLNSELAWWSKEYRNYWAHLLLIRTIDLSLQGITFPIYPKDRARRRKIRNQIKGIIYSNNESL